MGKSLSPLAEAQMTRFESGDESRRRRNVENREDRKVKFDHRQSGPLDWSSPTAAKKIPEHSSCFTKKKSERDEK